MADFGTLFNNKTASKAGKDKKPTPKITNIHYQKLVRNANQYCDAGDEEIENLADVISASGGILQPLLVRKIDADLYEIIAGHKRRDAAALLVEERGMEKYGMLPCIVTDSDDIKTRWAVVSTNTHHTKTPYEIMHEIEEMRVLLTEYPDSFPDIKGGRMVERLAEQLHMARSTVSEYRSIANNLGPVAMESFKNGDIDKSAAVSLASLGEDEQEKLIANGVTTNKGIREYKKGLKPKKEAEESPKVFPRDESAPATSNEDNGWKQTNPEIHEIAKKIFDSEPGDAQKNGKDDFETEAIIAFYEQDIYPSLRSLISGRDKESITKSLKAEYGETYSSGEWPDGNSYKCYPYRIDFFPASGGFHAWFTWGRFVTKLINILDTHPSIEKAFIAYDARQQPAGKNHMPEDKPDGKDGGRQDFAGQANEEPDDTLQPEPAQDTPEMPEQDTKPYRSIDVSMLLVDHEHDLKMFQEAECPQEMIQKERIIVDALTTLLRKMKEIERMDE